MFESPPRMLTTFFPIFPPLESADWLPQLLTSTTTMNIAKSALALALAASGSLPAARVSLRLIRKPPAPALLEPEEGALDDPCDVRDLLERGVDASRGGVAASGVLF